jgi:hypothetical protein
LTDKKIHKRKVNNQIVTNLVNVSNQWIFSGSTMIRGNIPYGTKRNSLAIVFILESPHKSEIKPNEPAAGLTGRNIFMFTPELLNNRTVNGHQVIVPHNLTSFNKIDIYIINRIQYQTSYGLNTGFIRDKVFESLWGKIEYRTDFRNQIKEITKIHDDIFFLDCCTSKPSSFISKQEIFTFSSVLTVNERYFYTKLIHPSSWKSNLSWKNYLQNYKYAGI